MTNEERDSAITTMRVQVTDMHKAIMGNGQPGLLDRMTRNELALAEAVRRTMECPAREAFSGGALRMKASNLIALAACVVSLIAVLVTVASK